MVARTLLVPAIRSLDGRSDSPPPCGAEPWQVIGCTVRGASHARQGIANQDCLKYAVDDGRVILALADGHGNATSFRSDLGSRFAVDASVKFAQELLNAARVGDRRFLSLVKDQLKADLPRRIVREWKARVDSHLAQATFTASEFETLLKKGGREGRQRIEQDNRLAYGSTLLTAITTEAFAVFWQIGDGDVLAVSDTGEVSRPVQKDPASVRQRDNLAVFDRGLADVPLRDPRRRADDHAVNRRVR